MTMDTIAGRFQELNGKRQSRLRAAEQFAYYTIPAVFPQEDDDPDNPSRGVGMLDSIGSIAANHFANKLVSTLFSPNRPFFRLVPNSGDPRVAELLRKTVDDDNEAEAAQAAAELNKVAKKFARYEKDGIAYLERIGYRTPATAAAKLLTVTGDTVIRAEVNKPPVVYSMRNYVCKKDMMGRDVLLILRDNVAYAALNAADQAAVQQNAVEKAFDFDTSVAIYTEYSLTDDGKRYQKRVAIENVDRPAGKTATMQEHQITHLSWNLIKGEDYGRGPTEDVAGSLGMIDQLTNHQTRIVAKMADLKILVDPASGLDVAELNNSETGTYVAGRPGDTGILGDQLGAGLQYVETILDRHKRQVAAAFLYQQGNTRDAERVTAEEIRENAAELEIAHGGAYTRFASDWQRQAAYEAMRGSGTVIDKTVEPQIMTGSESLSRMGEMFQVRMWLDDLGRFNSVPEEFRAFVKKSEFAQFAARARRIDHGAFIKSEEEVQQDIAAQQEREIALAQASGAQGGLPPFAPQE